MLRHLPAAGRSERVDDVSSMLDVQGGPRSMEYGILPTTVSTPYHHRGAYMEVPTTSPLPSMPGRLSSQHGSPFLLACQGGSLPTIVLSF